MNRTKASRASLKLRKCPFKGKRLRNQTAVISCSLVINPTKSIIVVNVVESFRDF